MTTTIGTPLPVGYVHSGFSALLTDRHAGTPPLTVTEWILHLVYDGACARMRSGMMGIEGARFWMEWMLGEWMTESLWATVDTERAAW